MCVSHVCGREEGESYFAFPRYLQIACFKYVMIQPQKYNGYIRLQVALRGEYFKTF